jgi:hypothetical protein
MKSVVVVMMLAVLGALVSAGVFMWRGGKGAAEAPPGERQKLMARALALRVGLSVAVFLLILLGWYMGWVKPTGIPMAQ